MLFHTLDAARPQFLRKHIAEIRRTLQGVRLGALRAGTAQTSLETPDSAAKTAGMFVKNGIGRIAASDLREWMKRYARELPDRLAWFGFRTEGWEL